MILVLIPWQLQKNRFRFIPLNGKIPLIKDWTKINFAFSDTVLLNYLRKGANYGVCTGIGNLLVIDIDNPTPEFMAKFYTKMPATFTVKTGKKGYHFYYLTKKPIRSKKIDLGTVHIDIQGIGKQVVGPTSIHPETKNKYEVINDIDLSFLQAYTLFDMFGEYYVQQTHNPETDKDYLLDILNKIKENVKYEDKGSYFLINCPYHPPDTHPSFAIYKNTFLGYDFHNDQIYLLKDIAIKLGIHIEPHKKEKLVVLEKFSPVYYAEPILKKNKFLLDKYKRFWRYDIDEGIWKENAEEWLRSTLRKNLFGPETQKINYVNEVVAYIRDTSYKDIEFKSPRNIIAFKNVAYDLETRSLTELRPEYYITNKIPVVLDENIQDCPKIDKFFTELLGDEKKIILYELIAYSLYRDYPYQKIFYLYGSGGNGKSTFLDLLMTFLGAENVASETPHSLISNRFSAGNLFNKLANISSDISYELLENPNKIKMLSGGDYINCERKFKDAFPFRNFAKLIFSTNMLPPTNDKSYAYYRRLYLIEFTKKFTSETAKKNILYELTTPDELSGLAWKCLDILQNMKDRGWSFVIDPDVEEVQELYERLSNPVFMFVEENCEDDVDSFIYVQSFYKDFQIWSKRKGFPILGNHEITKFMQNMGYSKARRYAKSKEGNSNNRAWAFTGLKWKNQDLTYYASKTTTETKEPPKDEPVVVEEQTI